MLLWLLVVVVVVVGVVAITRIARHARHERSLRSHKRRTPSGTELGEVVVYKVLRSCLADLIPKVMVMVIEGG